MTVVDVHTHFIPRSVLKTLTGLPDKFGVRESEGWLVYGRDARLPLPSELLDINAKLAAMDDLGVDISVLSLAPALFFYSLPRADATSFATSANDALAEVVRDSSRLRGFATLPLQVPEAAAAELERCVCELNMNGAQIGTTYPDGQLIGDELAAVFEVANHLGVPLMLHPDYSGPVQVQDFFLLNSIGVPLDTCLAAAGLVHRGVIDRWPDLRILLVHGGGYFPYALGRLDRAYAVRPEARTAIGRPPSAYAGNFWIDSLTHSDQLLSFLAELVGVDRMVLGTDSPFEMADPEPLERLKRIGLDMHALGTSAEGLLGLRL